MANNCCESHRCRCGNFCCMRYVQFGEQPKMSRFNKWIWSDGRVFFGKMLYFAILGQFSRFFLCARIPLLPWTKRISLVEKSVVHNFMEIPPFFLSCLLMQSFGQHVNHLDCVEPCTPKLNARIVPWKRIFRPLQMQQITYAARVPFIHRHNFPFHFFCSVQPLRLHENGLECNIRFGSILMRWQPRFFHVFCENVRLER